MAVEFAPIDMAARGQADLLSQDVSRPRIESLVAALAAGAEQLDTLSEALVSTRSLSTAVGALLDQWGVAIGQDRSTLPSDTYYRNFITARALANRSTGTRDELIAIADTAAGLNVVVEQYDVLPAEYTIVFYPNVTWFDEIKHPMRRLMDDSRPMGIGANYVHAPSFTTVFRFDTVGQGFDVGTFAESF